jgi:hypothetical protein
LNPTFSGPFVTIDSAGNTVVSSTTSNTMAVIRLDVTGTIDTTFGNAGLVLSGPPGQFVPPRIRLLGSRPTTDGTSVIGVTLSPTPAELFEIRLDAAGAPDETFGPRRDERPK